MFELNQIEMLIEIIKEDSDTINDAKLIEVDMQLKNLNTDFKTVPELIPLLLQSQN